jgi:hypothetical protein
MDHTNRGYVDMLQIQRLATLYPSGKGLFRFRAYHTGSFMSISTITIFHSDFCPSFTDL